MLLLPLHVADLLPHLLLLTPLLLSKILLLLLYPSLVQLLFLPGGLPLLPHNIGLPVDLLADALLLSL